MGKGMYKRPVTDFKFNMALLPPPIPAVVVSPYFSVVGAPLDVGLLAGPGMFSAPFYIFTVADDTSSAEPEQGLTSSMGCWDLAMMVQEGMLMFFFHIF
ncbi:hypothetical protein BDV98DRAFT_568220 [Pterulicium gracile]|uniref:Uncharacterized protein n=1 Tax=Pterulicium gracile TaxID=1884261 RepID=A0A5C3QG47_9AGAR|nr:hypothetical protein BDV98DRAFT_568220 [Pterula gracilis]